MVNTVKNGNIIHCDFGASEGKQTLLKLLNEINKPMEFTVSECFQDGTWDDVCAIKGWNPRDWRDSPGIEKRDDEYFFTVTNEEAIKLGWASEK